MERTQAGCGNRQLVSKGTGLGVSMDSLKKTSRSTAWREGKSLGEGEELEQNLMNGRGR